MYGLIGSIVTTADGREEVIAALLAGSRGMPGNLAYLVAEDAEDPTVVWVTEAWDSEQSHRASLELPQVAAAIARARPHIVRLGTRTVTRPVLAEDA